MPEGVQDLGTLAVENFYCGTCVYIAGKYDLVIEFVLGDSAGCGRGLLGQKHVSPGTGKPAWKVRDSPWIRLWSLGRKRHMQAPYCNQACLSYDITLPTCYRVSWICIPCTPFSDGTGEGVSC